MRDYKPDELKVEFAKKLNQLRENKEKVYAQMKKQAEYPETIAYYKSNDIAEIDLEIIEEAKWKSKK